MAVLGSLPARAETFAFELFSVESSSRTLIARGARTYSRDDAEVVETTGLGQKFLQKRLRLGNGYVVGLSDHRDARLDGLGCWLNREPSRVEADPYPGFSWEWFNRSGGDVFEKLQGGGRIRVTTKSVAGSQLVERVDFLDDMTFRLDVRRDGMPGTHTHEMLIRKGSALAFPLDVSDRAPRRVTLQGALAP